MRDVLSKSKTVALGENSIDSISSCSGETDSEKKKFLPFISDDIIGAILDMGFQRMLKKEKVHPQSGHLVGTLELWSDDFEDKGDFGIYRSRMVCIFVLSSLSVFITAYLFYHSQQVFRGFLRT